MGVPNIGQLNFKKALRGSYEHQLYRYLILIVSIFVLQYPMRVLSCLPKRKCSCDTFDSLPFPTMAPTLNAAGRRQPPHNAPLRTPSAIRASVRQHTLSHATASRLTMGQTARSSLSKHVHRTFTTRLSSGCLTTTRESLTPSAILLRQAAEQQQYQTRQHALTVLEQTTINSISTGQYTWPASDSISDDNSPITLADILMGESMPDGLISHEGGEFADLLAIEDEVFGPHVV